MAFKMKGNPMKRNFNVGGSPMAMKNAPLKQDINQDNPPDDFVASEGGGYKGLMEGEVNPQDAKNKYMAIEKQLEDGNITIEDAQKKYQALEKRIAMFLEKLGATKNEETGDYTVPASTSAKNMGIVEKQEGILGEMITQYNTLVDKQNDLSKQYEQRFYDYGAARSDSTSQAQGNITF